MRAYIMSGPGELNLENIPDPGCDADEVVLRTEAVSVCSTDISYFRGHLFPGAWPIIPGHEYVGRVVEVGANLRRSVDLGERLCYWGQSDFGGMADYRAIRPLFVNRRTARETTWYTERNFYDAHQAAAVVVPPELPGHTVTIVEPLTSVLRSLLMPPPKPGDRCVLLGCGPSGHLALQVLTRHFGVGSVTVIDRDDTRLARAARSGAGTVLNSERQPGEVEALVREHRDHFADYVFDALPHVGDGPGKDVRELAMGLLRPAGTYVIYGASGLNERISTWMILAKGLRLRAAAFDVRLFPMVRSAHVAELALRLLTHGIIDADPVVSSHIDFDDEAAVRHAFVHYGANGAMKPSITSRQRPVDRVLSQPRRSQEALL